VADVVDKLKLLGSAALEMNKSGGLGDGGLGALERILALASEALKLEQIAILTCDKGSRDLVVRAALGYGDVTGRIIVAGKGICGAVFASGTGEVVGDVRQDPRYEAGVKGGRTEMAAPLKIDDNVIGVLDTECPDLNAFDESELEVFSLFAALAATALANAERRATMEHDNRKLRLLNRAARAVSSNLDVDTILDKILGLATDALEVERCAVLLPVDGGEGLIVKTAVGYDEVVGNVIPKGQGICNAVFEGARPEVVDDVSRDPRYVAGIVGGRAEMAAPMRLDGDVIGVLDAESPEVGAFSEHDLVVFTAFAHHAATALRNARFVASLRRRARRLSLLNKASCTVSSALDLETVLGSILEMSAKALSFERCAIVMPTEDGELTVRAAHGYGEIVGKKIPTGAGVSGTVFETGMSERIADVSRDLRYVAGSEGARSEMAAPMVVNGEVIGVLDAESPTVDDVSKVDLEVFEALAGQAAVAVRNARLFQGMEDANAALKSNLLEMARLNKELEAYTAQVATARDALATQVRQLTALHHAGQAVVSSLDLETTLEAIVTMTQDIVESSSTTIKLIDRETEELRVKVRIGKQGQTEGVATIDLPLVVGDKTIGMFELESVRAYGEDERRLLETLASQAAIAIENARLFEDTQQTYYDTLKSLAGVLDARDAYTRGHSQRVADLAGKLTEQLGLDEKARKEIYSAALLHDIGKIGVRDDVLLKPGKLSAEEMETIRSHPIFGDAILAPLKFLGRVTGMVKHHHERWDGKGYPDGLVGDDIPLASRIVAVADTYDALTSDRPYRARRTHEVSMKIIVDESGKQFDAQVVSALAAVMDAQEGGETESGASE
jgi:putative nucleotidyltransferase with HDIG domain